MSVKVNVDNFVRAETARMFDGLGMMSGEVNKWFHFRAPTPLDKQTVIRMNRDTLYSAALADLTGGVTVTLPEAAGRYMTMMVVNEDHHINEVYDKPGAYRLSADMFGSSHVLLAPRTFVDPEDPVDIAAVNALQDESTIEAGSSMPFEHPDYDKDSLDETREALLSLAGGLGGTDHMFGRERNVDPVRHLIGSAFGWGGLPETEAYYYVEAEPHGVGRYTLTLTDVPVDAFWSVTIYNKDGYLEPNPYDVWNINSVTADADESGRVVLNLTPEKGDLANFLYVMDGWNYALRLYKPRASALDKTWTPPEPMPA